MIYAGSMGGGILSAQMAVADSGNDRVAILGAGGALAIGFGNGTIDEAHLRRRAKNLISPDGIAYNGTHTFASSDLGAKI